MTDSIELSLDPHQACVVLDGLDLFEKLHHQSVEGAQSEQVQMAREIRKLVHGAMDAYSKPEGSSPAACDEIPY